MVTESVENPGHGHSPAAWTSVIVMLLGFTLATVFFVVNMPTAVWVSVAVILVGLALGPILSKAGYGVNGPKYQPKEH